MIEIKTTTLEMALREHADRVEHVLSYYEGQEKTRDVKLNIGEAHNGVSHLLEGINLVIDVMWFDDNEEYRSVVTQIHRLETDKRKLLELIY